MKAIVIHPGTQYSHRLVSQLNRVGYLQKFITGIAFTANDSFLRWLPDFVKAKLSNRVLDESISPDQLQRIPIPELMAWIHMMMGGDVETEMHRRNKAFQNRIELKMLSSAQCVIGFDTSSWIVAERLKGMKPYILDQSIAHPREKEIVYKELRNRYPDWSVDMVPKSETAIAEEEGEYTLSSKIVVASTFTKKSLLKQGVPSDKVVVNPYGVSKDFFRPRQESNGRSKIRFLYLGLLGARKGLPFLLEVWREAKLYDVAELWVAGPANDFAISAVRDIRGVFYKGRVPFKDVPELLDACDCLVFPSFFEGFGQVILEAMAAGLPVITTTATAGPDVIEDARDGFIFEPGDTKTLSEIMKRLANDKQLCCEMGRLAIEKVRAFSWDSYGDRWKVIMDREN